MPQQRDDGQHKAQHRQARPPGLGPVPLQGQRDEQADAGREGQHVASAQERGLLERCRDFGGVRARSMRHSAREREHRQGFPGVEGDGEVDEEVALAEEHLVAIAEGVDSELWSPGHPTSVGGGLQDLSEYWDRRAVFLDGPADRRRLAHMVELADPEPEERSERTRDQAGGRPAVHDSGHALRLASTSQLDEKHGVPATVWNGERGRG